MIDALLISKTLYYVGEIITVIGGILSATSFVHYYRRTHNWSKIYPFSDFNNIENTLLLVGITVMCAGQVIYIGSGSLHRYATKEILHQDCRELQKQPR